MTGGSTGGSSMLSEGRRCKVCIFCDKNFFADEDKDDSKLPFSKEETSRLVDEEGSFSCGLHRRDQVCHDCFQDAVIEEHLAHADYLEHRAFRDTMDSAVKRMWKNIYLKEGDKVPWGDDEDKEVELPSSSSSSSSSSPRGNKKCAHCGKRGDLKRCSKCLVAFYCSKSHQAADYAKHKASCQAPKTPVNDTAQATQVRQDAKPSNDSQQPLHSSYKSCVHCGKTNNLSMCARCKSTYYCSKDHQVADYPNHKPECRLVAEMAKIHEHRPDMKSIWNHKPPRGPAAAQPAQMPVITWSELQKMHPNVATGRTLEVTIVSEPCHELFAPQWIDGRDAEGMVMRVALVTYRPPQGLRKGCILRWRNPWFHFFLDGATGANIENWDLPNISVE